MLNFNQVRSEPKLGHWEKTFVLPDLDDPIASVTPESRELLPLVIVVLVAVTTTSSVPTINDISTTNDVSTIN